MGLQMKLELALEPGLHGAGGDLVLSKKKQKKNEKSSSHDDTLQRSLVQHKRKKERRENCEIGELQGHVDVPEHNGNMDSQRNRKIKEMDARVSDDQGLPHKKRSRYKGEDEEKRKVEEKKRKKDEKKKKKYSAEEVPEDGSNNITVLKSDEKLPVSVFGKDAQDEKFRPFHSFSNVQVPKEVLECCNKFQKPSPIQAYSWPFLLHSRDLIGIAATGSGKTLAFGVPALVHVLSIADTALKQKYATCLVLSPTRELAQQISEVLVEAGRPCGVRTACFYGGTSKKPQYAALKTGVDIIVATPGRLQDLVDEGRCSLQKVSFVVLDEADRMLDLGFEDAVRALVNKTLKRRQTIMFSATWPTAVHQLAMEFMGEDPIKVIVGSQDLAANHAVSQVVEVIDSDLRDLRLMELLNEYHKSERNRILVFVLYKKEAVRVENLLQRRGWNVSAVHGDKGQFDRNKAVMSFKNGACPLLIATDVAARGLDIPDVEYVINYSFPLTTEDYVHRIGRTGRAGKSGIAHTFFTHADKARAGELVNVLKEAGQKVPSELLKFGTSVKKKESKLYGAHFKDVAVDAPKATRITFDSSDEE